MHNKKNSEVITKHNYPEFFEILEKSLAGLKIPKITVGKSRVCFCAKASHLSYSIFFNRVFWGKLNNQERAAVALHETGHLNSPVHRFRIYFILIISLIMIPCFVIYLYMPHFIPVNVDFFFYFNILLFMLFIYVRFFLIGILCVVSIWDEYFADDFASQRIDKKYLISALKKLPREKTPLYRVIYYSLVWPFETHPSIRERIVRLLKKNSNTTEDT